MIMRKVSLVIGQAGTGKTTWLMQKAEEYAPQLLIKEHQRVLAITRMHGARRRVETKWRESCPQTRCLVATIDGFALSIVNRWRTSLGYVKPVQAVCGEADFTKTIFGTEADFERVLGAATRLLQSPTVKKIIREGYPLVLIDEFQDCFAQLLEFVKGLSDCSTLLLAADEFQLLDATVPGCPAVDWVRGLNRDGFAQIKELTVCHRTSARALLRAARCLRDNIRSDSMTIPVVCCPQKGPAAWKIIEALVYNSKQWHGTTALICPSHDPFLHKVLESCANQLQKRNLGPIRWHEECDAGEEQRRIRAELGFADGNSDSSGHWRAPSAALGPIGSYVVERTRRFARLRGLEPIPHTLVQRHVETVIHEKRAYCALCPSRSVTTVHGAKNREFDNVFVLWTYKVPPDITQQRRLLYNAVTRSKENCMVLVWGDVRRAENDPVLSLLGPPQPAFSQKTTTKKPQ